MTRVLLHVGPPKTGSTYLQRLLWLHREDLARQDVLVPLAHENEMWLAANDVQDGAFVRTDQPEGRGAWARVTGRALASPGRSVLSHELLGLSTGAHVERIITSLASADVHVVVMARSLAATLPSLWQEAVKMADPDSAWPEFLAAQRAERSPWTDPAGIVRRWSRHLPTSSVHVVTVPPRGTDPAVLLGRFAEAVGIDVRGWGTGADRNESLGLVQVELLRRLNRATDGVLDERARTRLNYDVVVPALAGTRSGPAVRIPVEHRAWVEAETERRRRALDASGAVLHGFLTDLADPEDAWTESPATVTDADLLDAAVALLARLPVAEAPRSEEG